MSGHGAETLEEGETPSGESPRVLHGRYRLVDKIGSGGMGVVYRAVDESSGNHVALKQLLTKRSATSQALALFEREYQTLASLSHPRIIRTFDYGIDDSGPYYTMELLEGQDLRELAPLPYHKACLYLRDVATSLALLHARRLVHRDVTPRNVRVTGDGHCKLLDFGALAAFGATDGVVGTAHSIPPEALESGVLDQRSDLYSLGALAYWLLSGRHAYPARRLDELPEMWARRIKGPASIVPEIPQELDRLVLQLLRRDPLARPASAAEVIDRLNHVAGLADEHEADVLAFAQSYLINARLVDREAQLSRVGKSLAQAARSEGCSLWVEASGGMGRTRLLAEAGIQAQLSGAAVASADASGSKLPFDTTRKLAQALLRARPESARALSRSQLAAVAMVDHGLAERLGADAKPPPLATGEDFRVDAPLALQQLFVEHAKREPLLVAVDNVEESDEASLALLVTLARHAPQLKLVLLLTCRQTERPSTSSALRRLREHSQAIELEGLAASATTELMGSLFGEPEHLGRFSEWLHTTTSGSPMYSIDLVKQMLSAGLVRYVDGLWLLPAERPELARPQQLDQVLAMRLSKLSPTALSLAQGLSVMRGTLTFDLCAKLAERTSTYTVYNVIEELAQARVLVVDGESCAFTNDALRTAALASMEAAQRETCHRDAAAILLAAPTPDLRARLEAGRQLMEGGERSRGADLVRASVEGVMLDAGREELRMAVGACELALQVYVEQGRSAYEQAPLLSVLASSTFYVDWRLGGRIGPVALAVLGEVTGTTLATRLRRFLGGHLSLVVGLLVAACRFAFKRSRVGYTFTSLIESLFAASSGMAGASAVLLDREGVRKAAGALEPFAVLGDKSLPGFMFNFARSLEMPATDRWARTLPHWTKLAQQLDQPSAFGMPETQRQATVGGAFYIQGVSEAFRGGDGALRCALKLDQTGIAMYRMQAHQLRSAHHAYRGELDKSARYNEYVELYAAQVGSAWQVDVWYPCSMILVSAAIGDVMLSRGIAERLYALSREMPSLRLYALQARACLQLVRGDLDACVETYNQVMLEHEPFAFAGWAALVGFRAAALNQLGHHEHAKASCTEALSYIDENDRKFVVMCIWLYIELAMAEASLGNSEHAAELLEERLGSGEAGDNPLVCGSLHHARARVALLAADRDAFATHRAETERWFTQTRTPALIARSEQLSALELRAPWRPRSSPAPQAAEELGALLAECPTDENRAERALSLILRMSGGERGVLFRVSDGELRSIAHQGDDKPPVEVERQLLAMARDVSADSTTATETVSQSHLSEMQDSSFGKLSGYRLLLLTVSDAQGFVPVAAVAVVDSQAYRPPSFDCLDAIARSLRAETTAH